MKKNKLFYLLATFTPKEIKQFKRFVVGQKKPNMIKLVDLLTKNIGDYSSSEYDTLKTKSFQKLSSNRLDNDQKKRRLLSDTFQLATSFLALKELEENSLKKVNLLQSQYKKRGLTSLYTESLFTIKSAAEQNPQRDFYYHQSMVQLRHDFYFNTERNKYKEKDLLSDFTSIHTDLDLSYLIAKLHYACQVNMIQKLRGKQSNSFSLELVMQQVQTYSDNPVIILYLDLLLLIKKPEKKQFLNVKAQWFEIGYMFSKEIQLQLFVLLLNLSYYSFDKDHGLDAMFELYEYGFASDLLLETGLIDSSHFNNFVDIGCSIGQLEKVRSFVKKYLSYLNIGKDKRENVSTLCDAFLLFEEGKYEKALQQTNFLEFSDVSYGLRTYLLTIKSLYETKKSKGYEEIETRCEAFKQYLHRKYKQRLINKQTKEGNLNFIKIVRLLPFASSGRFAKINKLDLLKKTKAMERLVSRPWLLDKINQLS